MDFDSPDPEVEKEFPGLFASESTRKKDDDDCKFKVFSEVHVIPEWADCLILFVISVSDGDHEKASKKELLLLGRRKEKKDKKDRGYATLDGESSPEEDFETK